MEDFSFSDDNSSNHNLEGQETAEIALAVDTLLYLWNVPAHLGRFACVIIYDLLAPLNYSDTVEITDSEIAERLNCSKGRVSQLRAEFQEWQQSTNIGIFYIPPRTYNREKQKNNPTKYRLEIEILIFNILRRAHDFNWYKSDWKKAIRKACKLVCDSTTEYPAYVERAKTRKKSKADLLALYLLSVQRFAEKAVFTAWELGYSTEDALEMVKGEIKKVEEKAEVGLLEKAFFDLRAERLKKKGTDEIHNLNRQRSNNAEQRHGGDTDEQISDDRRFGALRRASERETDLDFERLEAAQAFDEKQDEIDE